MNADARRSALRDFLRGCRARLLPADVGLPPSGARRVPGLRREEVAELAGVSTHWYALFESGTTDRHFSAEFVGRVAGALQLNEQERSMLSRLALPEVANAIDVYERSARDGAFRSIRPIRDFARTIGSAGSFEEAALAAIKTIQDICRPDSMTVASLERAGRIAYALAVGRQARFADNRQAQAFIDTSPQTRYGATVLCENAPDPRYVTDDANHAIRIKLNDGREFAGMHTPDPLTYRDFSARAQLGSGLMVPLFEGSTYRGVLGASWRSPRLHSIVEIDAMETVSAILSLLVSRRSV